MGNSRCIVLAIIIGAIPLSAAFGADEPTTFEEGMREHRVSLSLTEAFTAPLTPLVADLDGDGLELLSKSESGLYLDIDGDGFAEASGWIGPDDALLAKDIDGDGRIGQLRELFGFGVSSPLEELATLDENDDQVIDSNDDIFDSLRIWRDANSNAEVDIVEVSTLRENGITRILLEPFEPEARQVNGNQVKARISFLRDDGDRGSLSFVRLRIDNYASRYLGDKSVSAVAAAQPNIRGRGTLPDLHVAMTQNAMLLDAVSKVMPTLTVPDLAILREAVKPILAAWAAPETASYSSIPFFVEAGVSGAMPRVIDFAVPRPDSSTWALIRGDPDFGGRGVIILSPNIDDVIADMPEGAELLLMDGIFLGFFARLIGEEFSLEKVQPGDRSALKEISRILNTIIERLDVITVRLAIQGPLGASYFRGLSYDAASDTFHPVTPRQLIPVFEAIFADAPRESRAAVAYLEHWRPILRVIKADYKRGASHLRNSYSFLFANMVSAYESVGFVGGLSIVAVAERLGIPENLVLTASNAVAGVLVGTDDPDIFYLTPGALVVRGGPGFDVYVYGGRVGTTVIEDFQPHAERYAGNLIRLTSLTPADVQARRDGVDLVITVTSTGNTIRVVRQFASLAHIVFGGKPVETSGITEIAFADGALWDPLDIARAVSDPQPTDQVIIGTPTIDYLDGGAGDDHLEGRGNGDVYSFGAGYGHDVIHENLERLVVDAPDVIVLSSGLSREDIALSFGENRDDMVLTLPATGDTLTVKGQFASTRDGSGTVVWPNQIEGIIFDNGYFYNRDDMTGMVLAQEDGAGEDSTDGGSDNHYLAGNGGSDTYTFGPGFGHDVIFDMPLTADSGDVDVVVFSGGITLADVEMVREGDDLVISLEATGDRLTVQDMFRRNDHGVAVAEIEVFRFSGGRVTLGPAEIRRLLKPNPRDGEPPPVRVIRPR